MIRKIGLTADQRRAIIGYDFVCADFAPELGMYVLSKGLRIKLVTEDLKHDSGWIGGVDGMGLVCGHLCLEYENGDVQFFALDSLKRTVKYSGVDVSCFYDWIRITNIENKKVRYIDRNLNCIEWMDGPIVIEKVIDGKLFVARLVPVDFNHVTTT